MRRLIDVKRDIVRTIRQAVDVVSKYAGEALPEPARTRVRGFILTLPQRWASKAGGTGAGVISSAGINSERDSTVTAAASGKVLPDDRVDRGERLIGKEDRVALKVI